ncbi:MAG: ATP-dependent helicase HrpB [Bdellovibrionales bacterium GWB1_55_8]|nr:MAG: ATP-dependent helicase HrpB [Bdellovibrionales bacterium GWB1_55_8]
MNQSLPIDASLPEILASLNRNNRLILQAAPGSGKTTRVPAALLDAEFSKAREILVLEPRRLAAKWAALRVSDERGEPIGQTVGYRFRFENVGGSRTRLRFVTEGMFTRMLLENPWLEGIAAVVLDEFHERHLQADFALGYVRRLQETERPDLRLVVMSATLDTEALTQYLRCPVVQVNARQFPIEIEYLRTSPPKSLDLTIHDEIVRLVSDPLRDDGGDILVFLPGMGDIRRTAETLSSVSGNRGGKLSVLLLHGDLSRAEQDRAMLKSPERRVILSTNIAETSLTIEGVTIVIDSGLHRIAGNSWWSGVPSLRTRPISRASAAQRAGRAGRMGPGRCIRLYTRGDHDSRAPFEVSEISRLDLAQTILELKSLRTVSLTDFPWFEDPPVLSVGAACELLYRLGAVQSPNLAGDLSPMGEQMIRIPAHPRLARMLLEAASRGALPQVAALAALISESGLSNLDALGSVSQNILSDRERRVRDLFVAAARSVPGPGLVAKTNSSSQSEALARSALAGFPDRVAKKRAVSGGASRGHGTQVELMFSSGGATLIENSEAVNDDDFFVVIDAQENKAVHHARARTIIRSLCGIKSEWLFDLEPGLLQERDEYEWDAQREKVFQVSSISHGQLVLAETRKPAKPGPKSLEVLLNAGLGLEVRRLETYSLPDWLKALGRIVAVEALENACARLSLVARYRPESGIQDPYAIANVFEVFRRTFDGKTTLAELRDTAWETELVLAFGCRPDLLLSFSDWVPTSIGLPSGRRARVHYKVGQDPWVASRLQDFFGMKQGPSLFSGKLPVILHLLAPNQRPVQVTADLQSFWQKTYPEIRNQLSRRYPKHAWPADPFRQS